MSEKANYFKIGLFFIVSVILIVTAVIVWGAGLFTKDKIFFETYFDSPVTGLNIGSSVEVMGVKIGQVEDIDFVSSVYDISTDPTKVSKYEHYIRVLCSMSTEESEKRAGQITVEQRKARTRSMIEHGLRLRLASNILTGQSYLEGVFVDPNRFPILPLTWESKYTYVASAPGEFSTIKDSLDKILEKIEEIEFQKIVDNLNQLLVVAKETVADANIPGMTDEIMNFFAELRVTNQEIQALLINPDEDAKKTNLAQIMAKLDNTLENINRILMTETPEIDKFLHNLRIASDDLKELIATLKKHPSEIIFSQPPAKSEIVK